MNTTVNMPLKKLSRNFVRTVHAIYKKTYSAAVTSEITGLSESTIRRIEGARIIGYGRGMQGYTPTLSSVVKLSKATGLTIDEVLKVN